MLEFGLFDRLLVEVGAVEVLKLFCRLLFDAGLDMLVVADGASLRGREAATLVADLSLDLSLDLNSPILLFEFFFCNFAPMRNEVVDIVIIERIVSENDCHKGIGRVISLTAG